jgi:hypothetical protein
MLQTVHKPTEAFQSTKWLQNRQVVKGIWRKAGNEIKLLEEQIVGDGGRRWEMVGDGGRWEMVGDGYTQGFQVSEWQSADILV